MDTSGKRSLNDWLGDEPAARRATDALDSADRERLLALAEQAHRKQTATLIEATEASLKHVPALLRPAVRKLLFR